MKHRFEITLHPVEGTRRGGWVWKLSVRLADVDSWRAIRFQLIQLMKQHLSSLVRMYRFDIPFFGCATVCAASPGAMLPWRATNEHRDGQTGKLLNARLHYRFLW